VSKEERSGVKPKIKERHRVDGNRKECYDWLSGETGWRTRTLRNHAF